MKLVPLGDKVIMKQMEAEEKTKSGIVLASQSKEKPFEAVVVAVGPGGNINGKDVEMVVKAGDRVLYSQYGGSQVKFEDETFIVIKQSEILAIVQE